MTKVTLAKGDTLFAENDPADVMYYVVSGEIEIFTIVNGEMLELDVVKAGDVFGEMGLLLKEARSANAMAREETVLASISRREMMVKIQTDAGFGAKMIARLAHKLKSANNAVKDQLGAKRSLEIVYGGAKEPVAE